jgi:hypothetical protein
MVITHEVDKCECVNLSVCVCVCVLYFLCVQTKKPFFWRVNPVEESLHVLFIVFATADYIAILYSMDEIE